MSPVRSTRDPGPWEGAFPQVEEVWLEGPYELSRDAVLEKQVASLRWHPSFRFGVHQGEEIRAVGDLQQRATNLAAQVSRPLNLPTSGHFFLLFKL